MAKSEKDHHHHDEQADHSKMDHSKRWNVYLVNFTEKN